VQEKNSNFQNVNFMEGVKLNIDELIKAGAHFGHPVSKWNPKYKKFISATKNGIHIINLELTLKYIDNAINELMKIVNSGGNILFVGTKSQAKDAVQSSADYCGMYYITERWLGGTLTNYSTIKKSIRRLKLLEKDSSSIYDNLTKKELGSLEREKLRLADLHRGIKDMRHLPSAIFVVDAKHEKISISEAKCLGIPTFGIVDTNTDPNVLDYPIPANDDSIKTIQMILNTIAKSLSDLLGKDKESEIEELTDASNNAQDVSVDQESQDQLLEKK
tara:strand:+ start:429 stop:1253 length:825 start_codon:yes stop_codon:yes gene_type:complete